MGDIEVFSRPAPAPAAEPAPFNAFAAAPAYDEPEDDSGLISPPAASQAASAFSQLSRTVSMPSEGRTLEDVVREMLRPMLKEWLDSNLSSIVETAVQAEVERISRRRF
jgi:cell pole-organizing protein PopZ